MTEWTYVSPVTGYWAAGNLSDYHDPRGTQGRLHSGNDLQAANGSTAVATIGGRVLYAGRMQGYGANVVVLGDDGNVYRYATHASYDVKPGQIVAQGQPIGKIGEGHLHFEVIPPEIDGMPNMAFTLITAPKNFGKFVPTQTWPGGPIPTVDPMSFFGASKAEEIAAGQPIGYASKRSFVPSTPDQFIDVPTADVSKASPDVKKLAGMMLAEARVQGPGGMLRVGYVAQNRVDDKTGMFPDSLDKAINSQFAKPMSEKNVSPEEWAQAVGMAQAIKDHAIPDLTNGALWFATPAAVKGNWANFNRDIASKYPAQGQYSANGFTHLFYGKVNTTPPTVTPNQFGTYLREAAAGNVADVNPRTLAEANWAAEAQGPRVIPTVAAATPAVVENAPKVATVAAANVEPRRPVMYGLHGMESRYGKNASAQIAREDKAFEQYAKAHGYDYEPILTNGDNKAGQLAALKNRVQPGDGVIGFSGGAYTVRDALTAFPPGTLKDAIALEGPTSIPSINGTNLINLPKVPGAKGHLDAPEAFVTADAAKTAAAGQTQIAEQFPTQVKVAKPPESVPAFVDPSAAAAADALGVTVHRRQVETGSPLGDRLLNDVLGQNPLDLSAIANDSHNFDIGADWNPATFGPKGTQLSNASDAQGKIQNFVKSHPDVAAEVKGILSVDPLESDAKAGMRKLFGDTLSGVTAVPPEVPLLTPTNQAHILPTPRPARNESALNLAVKHTPEGYTISRVNPWTAGPASPDVAPAADEPSSNWEIMAKAGPPPLDLSAGVVAAPTPAPTSARKPSGIPQPTYGGTVSSLFEPHPLSVSPSPPTPIAQVSKTEEQNTGAISQQPLDSVDLSAAEQALGLEAGTLSSGGGQKGVSPQPATPIPKGPVAPNVEYGKRPTLAVSPAAASAAAAGRSAAPQAPANFPGATASPLIASSGGGRLETTPMGHSIAVHAHDDGGVTTSYYASDGHIITIHTDANGDTNTVSG